MAGAVRVAGAVAMRTFLVNGFFTDLTQYVEGRASPKAFLTHHAANIS